MRRWSWGLRGGGGGRGGLLTKVEGERGEVDIGSGGVWGWEWKTGGRVYPYSMANSKL